MKKIMRKLSYSFKHMKMGNQLIGMYFFAVFAPILLIGLLLMSGNIRQLTLYQKNLLQANNDRVRSVLYEITSQIYNISEEIAFDDGIVGMLSKDYPMEEAFKSEADSVLDLDKYISNYTGVESVTIYTDQTGAVNYRNFVAAKGDIATERWYKKALEQYSVFWETLRSTDKYGNDYYNLALVRKITLYDTNASAVLVVKISDNYLRSRIEGADYGSLLALPDGKIFYSSNREDYGKNNLLPKIDTSDDYFTFSGNMTYNGINEMSYISTLHMNSSESNVYVVTINKMANTSIQQIMGVTGVILLLALILPAMLMSIFIRSFSRQVNVLRDEVYKASKEDYNLLGYLDGCYELNAAYNDFKSMVENIKEKDKIMYEGRIAEQKLLNAQQRMEFQMLASQINPHFLYNTLEMIRMKAISAGDRETATAIKLLGKSMRYVLDNTGTEYTTLAKELGHIETYLQIQKLRFGDRVNYVLNIGENVNLEKIKILPLLLQPIVENAILHGLEEVEVGGKIEVSINHEVHGRVEIVIEDNGCGMSDEELIGMRDNLEKGTINSRYGIGLYNINQRIHISDGPEFGVTIDSEPGQGTIVTTTIRYRQV